MPASSRRDAELISSNNITVFYPLCPKPAVLALIFVIHCLALALGPSGQVNCLSVCTAEIFVSAPRDLSTQPLLIFIAA